MSERRVLQLLNGDDSDKNENREEEEEEKGETETEDSVTQLGYVKAVQVK